MLDKKKKFLYNAVEKNSEWHRTPPKERKNNMALTSTQVREILYAAGVPAENVEDAVKKIMDGHVTSINALREERDGYKTAAEQLPAVQKELDELKAKGDQNWQQQDEQEHADFEAYKTKVAEDKERDKKTSLYRELLKECNVGERQIPNVLKVSGDTIDGLTMKDGKLDGVEALKEAIKNDWAGFIMTEKIVGADVDKPPKNDGGKEPPKSRAAEIAAEYHKNLYGEMKGD